MKVITMKKAFAILLMILFASSEIYAGTGEVGIKGGMNFGTPVGKRPDGAKGMPKVQPIVGGYYKYNFNPKWSIQAELNYFRMKATYETPYYDFIGEDAETGTEIYLASANVVNGEFSNSYLNLPVMAYYDLGKNFNLTFGGYVSYLLSSSMTGTAKDVFAYVDDVDGSIIGTQEFAGEIDFPDQGEHMRKFDFGLNVGVQYELSWGLNFDIRANGGLSSFFKKDFDLAPGRYGTLNLQATVGYRLGGKQFF